MIKKKYIAPNMITAGNMFLGYLSILESIKGNFVLAIWYIILANIFDGLDGKTARKFDAFSEFGKEFDSFCDAISFGIAPSILVYSILTTMTPTSLAIIPISFLYALCGVMRLVKFNIVTTASSEKDDFSGMPIPNASLMVCSYYLICNTIYRHTGYDLFDVHIFITITVVAATLMVSTIPFKTPDKIFSFIPKKFIIPVIIVLIIFLKYSLFFVSYFYTFANLIRYFKKRFYREPLDEEDQIIEEIIVIEDEDEEEIKTEIKDETKNEFREIEKIVKDIENETKDEIKNEFKEIEKIIKNIENETKDEIKNEFREIKEIIKGIDDVRKDDGLDYVKEEKNNNDDKNNTV